MFTSWGLEIRVSGFRASGLRLSHSHTAGKDSGLGVAEDQEVQDGCRRDHSKRDCQAVGRAQRRNGSGGYCALSTGNSVYRRPDTRKHLQVWCAKGFGDKFSI